MTASNMSLRNDTRFLSEAAEVNQVGRELCVVDGCFRNSVAQTLGSDRIEAVVRRWA